MDANQRALIESEGLQVIEGAFNFEYKTRIFIRHPDGRLNPYYDYLHQIPIMPNGTEVDLAKTAMPDGAPGGGTTALIDGGAVTNVQWSAQADPQGLVPWVIVGYVIIAVIMLAIVICIYFILHPGPVPPPCGTEPQITNVTDCLKIITMPNCDSRTYNSCTEEWAEEGWHTWEPPANWMTYVIIGIVAIGAIIILPPILRSITKTSPPPQQTPPSPHWRQHPAYMER